MDPGEIAIQQVYEDLYKQLIEQPMPYQRFILPRSIEEIVGSMSGSKSLMGQQDKLDDDLYRFFVSSSKRP